MPQKPTKPSNPNQPRKLSAQEKRQLEALSEEARVHIENERFDEAARCYEKAAALSLSIKDSLSQAVFLNQLAAQEAQLGEPEKARQHLEESIRLAEDNEFLQVAVQAHLILAEQERERGLLDQASRHFIKALSIAEELQDAVGVELALGNLASIYLERGWAEQASDLLFDVLDINAIKENRATWLGTLGQAMYELGQYEQALTYFMQAHEEAAHNKDLKTQSICLGSQGNTYFEQKKWQQAIKCYEEAVKVARQANDGRREGIWLSNIGNVELKTGHVDKALKLCTEALELSRKHKDEQSQACHLDSIGDCYITKGETAKALDHYQKALVLSEKINDRLGQRIYLTNSAKAREKSGALAPAFECYAKAIDLFEEQRSHIRADDLKTSFAERGQDLFGEMINLCLKLGKRVEALEFVGRAKSRALLDLLSNSPIDISQVKDNGDAVLTQLIKRESDLRGQISHFERMFWQGPPENPSGTRGTVLSRDESQKLYANWKDAVEQLRRRHPNYASLISTDPISFQDLKQTWNSTASESLSQNTAIVEFFKHPDYLICACVTAASSEPALHVVSDKEQLEALEGDLDMLAEMAATEGWDVPKSLGKRIFDKLFGTLIDQIPPGVDRLLLVPHDRLYRLSFASLNDGKQYLCQRFALSYLPTSSLIPIMQKTSPVQNQSTNKRLSDKSSYLITAISDYSATRAKGMTFSSRLRSAAGLDDLSYTLEEAKTIYNMCAADDIKTRLVTNAEVKEKLPQLFGQYPVIHFAGHAIFNPDEPLASGLVLSDGTLVTAASILQGNLLRTTVGKLLVLSACQTGVHEVTTGGEILGLARALLYAGMPNLVLSLWEVADRSTANLMQEFHAKWQGGAVSVSEALRQAQIKAIEENQSMHAWAPFVHFGID